MLLHAALCWLRLSIMELRYTRVMRQSITLTLGLPAGYFSVLM